MNRFFFLGIVCTISLSSCSIDRSLRRIESVDRDLDIQVINYRIRPGDQLTFFYSLRQLEDTALYRIEEGDEIQLTVADRDDVSRTYTVSPDGYLHLPYVSAIRAAGATLDSVKNRVLLALKPVTIYAQPTLAFNQFQSKSSSFVQSLSQSDGRGPIFRTTVQYDGTVQLPSVGKVPVAGATYEQLSDSVQSRYDRYFTSLEVTPVIENASLSSVTILGEVNSPGTYPVSGGLTLSAAMGLAKGWRTSAHLGTVIVLHRFGEKIQIRKVNFRKELLLASQLQLAAGDVVFIPAKPITDVNVFIDEYIRRNIPIGVNTTIPLFP